MNAEVDAADSDDAGDEDRYGDDISLYELSFIGASHQETES